VNWVVALLAGVIGGLGLAGIIRSAFARDHLAARYIRVSGEQPRREPASASLAGGAGAAAEAISLIAVTLDHGAWAEVAGAAAVSILVGYVVYKWLPTQIGWLSILSLLLSLALLGVVLVA
jgi:hypothetical protein